MVGQQVGLRLQLGGEVVEMGAQACQLLAHVHPVGEQHDLLLDPALQLLRRVLEQTANLLAQPLPLPLFA